MRIGIIGTGIVGQTLAGKLSEIGHDLVMGTRDVSEARARTKPGNFGTPPLSAWLAQHPRVKLDTFAGAAAHGEVLLNAPANGPIHANSSGFTPGLSFSIWRKSRPLMGRSATVFVSTIPVSVVELVSMACTAAVTAAQVPP